MKIAVIGAGSTYTPELIKGFIEISKDVSIDEVVLHDVEQSAEKLISSTVHKKTCKGPFQGSENLGHRQSS